MEQGTRNMAAAQREYRALRSILRKIWLTLVERANIVLLNLYGKIDNGPTGTKFLDSKKLGLGYENDLFVGEIHYQSIYHFDLTSDRTELSLDGLLEDRISNNEEELEDTIFAQNFEGGITDLEVGPDGYLYVVSSIYGSDGKLYRIIPNGS